MAGSHRATSADSSPGSGGHRGGRALGREGRRWWLSPDVLLTDTPPPFLSLTDSSMGSHTQPPKHTGSRLFIHFSLTYSQSLMGLSITHSLPQPSLHPRFH